MATLLESVPKGPFKCDPELPVTSLHIFDVGTCSFTVHKRYQFKKVVGKGAYGVVVSCVDTQTGKNVAIKKVNKAFDDLTDSKRILREIMLLKHLKHENIVNLLDIVHPETSIDDFQDVYMVLDLMESDLHRIIRSRQTLSDDHVQFFLSQILKGLKYTHSAGVLHRDLKPSNLLVNSSCDLKICDFGLARGMNEDEVVLTEYVVTRWYRAPEVMLSSKSYDYGVDVWSTGCILAELLVREPIFQGDDYIHQLHLINDTLGSPTEEDLAFISSEKAKRFIRNLPKKAGIPFEQRMPTANPMALDLLKKMLAFNPAKRISVDDALNHPYLRDIMEESPPTLCESLFEFEYEQRSLDASMLRELVWKEMSDFHQDAKAEWEARRASGKMHIDKLSRSRSQLSNGGLDTPSSSEGTEIIDDSRKRKRLEDTITPSKVCRPGNELPEEKAASL